ncbi:uncharacterized protein V2V93DRAFT_392515 [Kockiozyma suomiensis]|uniref:uncharacterized protein n=1 Tax=Kockiozyma suomiensis TaxID=1337062 RepID=UPI003343F951
MSGPLVVDSQPPQQPSRSELPYGACLLSASNKTSVLRSEVDEERRKKLTEAIRKRRKYEQKHGALHSTSASVQNQTVTPLSTYYAASNGFSALKPRTQSSFGTDRITKYQSPFKKMGPLSVSLPKSSSSLNKLHNDVHITAIRNRLAPSLYGGLPSSPLAESLSPARPTRDVRRRPVPYGLSDSKSVDELLKRLVKEGNATDFPSFQALQERRKERMKAIEELRRPKKEIIPPLDQIQLSKVQQCLSSRDFGRTLISAFRIDISVRDIKTLGDGQWLNDNVIDFYLEMVTQRSREHAAKHDNFPRSFVYTTHFYSALSTKGYQAVARWGRRKQLNLANLDYIFVPINVHNTHWCVSVINIKEKRFEYYDSMAGGPGSAFSHLREYIHNESRTQNVPMDDIHEWEDYVPNDSPLQRNGYDCGVFTCKTVEVLSRDGPLTFSQKDMKILRQRMLFEILQGKLLNA